MQDAAYLKVPQTAVFAACVDGSGLASAVEEQPVVGHVVEFPIAKLLLLCCSSKTDQLLGQCRLATEAATKLVIIQQ